VMCLVEVPAQYKTITKRILKTPARVIEETIPATYKTISRKVIKTPATTREITIPAEYKTVTRQVLKTPATTREEMIPAEYKTVTRTVLKAAPEVSSVDIPAEYATVTKTVLVKKGGYTEWREVLCESEVTTAKIIEIQRALQAKGYDPGPIDNILGSKTRAALTKFQRDNGLAVGRITRETLKALGVE
jgi:hypothetical protein